MEEPKTDEVKIPQHQWTHDGKRVLLVKCLDKDGKGHGGFQYPKSGPVKPLTCSLTPDCESGGLFGWAWGINLGGGKEPDYRGVWVVLSAPPEQVILVQNEKCKVAADTPDQVDCIVEYYGDALGAMIHTMNGRVAWVQHNARGEFTATGGRGSASATGWSGSASATGGSGSASATGGSGSASATGGSGSASATGWRGSASATGWRGSASATGWSGSASATGWSGSASATGGRGSASATGGSGSASATGWSGSASATGGRGSASATGWSGSASATGGSGSASATGWRGSASATGWSGIATISGEYATVEVGPNSLGASTANCWYWRVRSGAVVAARWKESDGWKHAIFVADELGLVDGFVAEIENGVIKNKPN